MNKQKMVYRLVGIFAITAIGFLVIPPLMKKYSNKIYKSSLDKDEINFDEMGPEIVKKDNTEKE